MRNVCALLIVVAIATSVPAATTEPSAKARGVSAAGESVGGRLLDDLPQDNTSPAVIPHPLPIPKNTREIEDSLKAGTPLVGFGAGANPISQPLVSVQRKMQHAQALLAKQRVDARPDSSQLATPVQQEVLAELDRLAAELSKKCNGNGQCQGGQCQNPKPGQSSQCKPGKPGAAIGKGKTAARDSTDRLDRSSAQPVDKGQVDEMVKAVWGQLPERSREQMMQFYSNEFLPKYELEIEQYYRRLSEEPGDGQAK